MDDDRLDVINVREPSQELLQRCAWRESWYKAGFRHGMEAALETFRLLKKGREMPRNDKAYKQLEEVMLASQLRLADQKINGTFIEDGFIRLNHKTGQYEYYQPLTKSEAYDLMMAVLRSR